jgi:uncharacterized damage-inducible protein DinB
MSFAEQVVHLIECDRYLLARLDGEEVEPILGAPENVGEPSASRFTALLGELIETGEKRRKQLARLVDEDLSQMLVDRRFDGKISVWWLIVRGNLDHEIHHRGQIAAYLRVAGIIG